MIRVVILVHGMGVQGDKWAGDGKEVIRSAAQSYGISGTSFSDDIQDGKVAIKPIRYDDRFRAQVDQWGNDSRTMAAFIKQNAIAVPANIVSWLEEADETENKFLWSHVVDVILYRFMSLITTDVRVHVMKRIVDIWKDALEADTQAQVSVVAHSLGTSVTHDSLALLATDPPAGVDGFLAGDRRLANIFLLANVSRILETLPKVYDSVVCPPSVRGSRAYCGNLLNVRHELDPFAAPRPFNPTWTGDDFQQVTTHAIREFNTHSFEQYLADPRVHIPLLRSLFGFSAIPPDIAQQRISAYEAEPGPPCPQVLRDFITASRQRVQVIKESGDPFTLITAGVQFLADVQRVRESCEQS